MKKNIYYFTLEDMEGHIKLNVATNKLAKDLLKADKHSCMLGNEGICYKRKVGDNGYKKFMFMW